MPDLGLAEVTQTQITNEGDFNHGSRLALLPVTQNKEPLLR